MNQLNVGLTEELTEHQTESIQIPHQLDSIVPSIFAIDQPSDSPIEEEDYQDHYPDEDGEMSMYC